DLVVRPLAPALDLGPVCLFRPAVEPFACLGARIGARQQEGLAQEAVPDLASGLGPPLVETALQTVEWWSRGNSHRKLLDQLRQQTRERAGDCESISRLRPFPPQR